MQISPGLGRAAVLVGVAIAFADASIVVLAVPEVINQLDVSVAASSWVITAYNVAVVVAGALLIPAVGRFAPRRLAAVGFAAFALAALGCAAAPSFGVLVGFRTVQGLAAALVLVSALPLLGGRTGVRAWTLAATIGLAAGPALGGLLTELFSWRAIFAVQAPIAALGLLALLRLAAGERAAPGGKRPRTSWLADACLAALSAALVGALFLVVLLLISGFGWQPFPAALVATTPSGPGARRRPARPRDGDGSGRHRRRAARRVRARRARVPARAGDGAGGRRSRLVRSGARAGLTAARPARPGRPVAPA